MADNMSTTPAAVWENLKKANQRFHDVAPQHPHQSANRRDALVNGQNPVAVVLSCSDSRVPPEIVFDQGLGDLFVIRTAGEVIDSAVLGSIEYAVDGLGVPLVIVMGHECCGAVAATLEAMESGSMPAGFQHVLVEKVGTSVAEAKSKGVVESADVERHHVEAVVRQLSARSAIIKQACSTGSCGIVGARYRLTDGLVETVVEMA